MPILDSRLRKSVKKWDQPVLSKTFSNDWAIVLPSHFTHMLYLPVPCVHIVEVWPSCPAHSSKKGQVAARNCFMMYAVAIHDDIRQKDCSRSYWLSHITLALAFIFSPLQASSSLMLTRPTGVELKEMCYNCLNESHKEIMAQDFLTRPKLKASVGPHQSLRCKPWMPLPLGVSLKIALDYLNSVDQGESDVNLEVATWLLSINHQWYDQTLFNCSLLADRCLDMISGWPQFTDGLSSVHGIVGVLLSSANVLPDSVRFKNSWLYPPQLFDGFHWNTSGLNEMIKLDLWTAPKSTAYLGAELKRVDQCQSQPTRTAHT